MGFAEFYLSSKYLSPTYHGPRVDERSGNLEDKRKGGGFFSWGWLGRPLPRTATWETGLSPHSVAVSAAAFSWLPPSPVSVPDINWWSHRWAAGVQTPGERDAYILWTRVWSLGANTQVCLFPCRGLLPSLSVSGVCKNGSFRLSHNQCLIFEGKDTDGALFLFLESTTQLRVSTRPFAHTQGGLGTRPGTDVGCPHTDCTSRLGTESRALAESAKPRSGPAPWASGRDAPACCWLL